MEISAVIPHCDRIRRPVVLEKGHSMVSSGVLCESLTRREKDILTLLDQAMSDREIAEKLVLSLNSVKWYTRQVYGKLGVANRKEAVAKARELGLIGEEKPPEKTPAHNLPGQLTSFIGREKEIDQVVRMVWEYPLVTLTGAGGVGKTRLAQKAAGELLDDFSHGIVYVELASLANPQLVARTLAERLGVRITDERSILDSLIRYFKERQALVVLDNCEHLAKACAELVQALLAAAPEIKVLATSRQPLGVAGEAVFRAPSLTYPLLDEVEDALSFEAVRLFVERARSVCYDFQLTPANQAKVAQICRRLDGIPLAIELAAARTAMLSVEQIAERLEYTFSLLTSASRLELPRHRTLRAVHDWSYNLLSDGERALLQRLAIFAGGWTLAAAEQVCADAMPPAAAAGEQSRPVHLQTGQILDLLGSLVNQSLVQFDLSAGKEPRYRMLETVRQYGRQRLAESGEEESVCERHLAYYTSLAVQAEPHLRARQAVLWLERLDRELDNLRQALAWSLCHPGAASSGPIVNGLQMAAALVWWLMMHDHHWEGADWLQRLLQEQKAAGNGLALEEAARVTRGRALNALHLILNGPRNTWDQHLNPLLEAVDQESQAIFEALGDACPRDAALCHWLHFNRKMSIEDVLECRERFQAVHDLLWVAECDLNLLQMHWRDPQKAYFYAEENLALRKEIGDRDGEGSALYWLGVLSCRWGSLDRSIELTKEAIACLETVGDRLYAEAFRYQLALRYIWRGDHQEAARLLDILRRAASELSDRYLVFLHLILQGYLALYEKQDDLAVQAAEQALEVDKDYVSDQKVLSLFVLARVATKRGELARARGCLQGMLSIPGFGPRIRTLHALGLFAARQTQMRWCAVWFGAKEAAFTSYQFKHAIEPPLVLSETRQALEAARLALGENDFSAAWEAGRAMTEEQVLQSAMDYLREEG